MTKECSWEEYIIPKLVDFEKNRLAILSDNGRKEAFHKFLQECLINVELTIPVYGAYKNGKYIKELDIHKNILDRIFTKFLRAYLEEKETKRVCELNNIILKVVDDLWGIFKCGPGTPGATDFVDVKNESIKYDVKHDMADFTKAHNAKYIYAYKSIDRANFAMIELHDRDLKNGTYTGQYIECKTLSAIADELGINKILFNVNNLSDNDHEKCLREYFGLDE